MEVVLDAYYLGDKETAHAYLKEILGFPDYYGNNLDALYDCLTDYDDLTLLIKNTEGAGEYFDKLLPVLREACEVEFLCC